MKLCYIHRTEDDKAQDQCRIVMEKVTLGPKYLVTDLSSSGNKEQVENVCLNLVTDP